MHYIITDIHNDSWRFMKLLEKIDLKEDDHLYLLGDLFDRCMDHPDPAGVYFQVLKLGKKCTVIRGNHDHWLANYIFHYYGMDERDRALLQPYPYNSFHLLQERLTEVDLKQLAERISAKIPFSPSIILSDSSFAMMPCLPSIAAWAMEPVISSL